MKRNTRRISTLKMHTGRHTQSKLAAAKKILMVKLSLHKRRAGLIVLLGVLSAAVLAPNVLSLQASATAASTASTKQGLKQGTAPELLASSRASAALERLQNETGARVVSHLSNKTGNLDFVRATGDALLAADKGSGTPEARAQAFLSEHGALVGLSDAELRRVATGDSAASGPSSELRVVSVDRDNIGSAHVRFNQF